MKNIILNNKGNALWFILLAVALLGFLANAVSRNSSSINQSGNIEQAHIKATSLLRHSKSIEMTVQQMMLNGISENDLDFIAINANHDNTNCNRSECEVFSIEGGGIGYISVASLINDNTHTDTWHVSTENRVYQFGCGDANNSCTELILLAKNIPKSVCLQINKIQGITNPNNDAPQQSEISEGPAFTGSYSSNVNSVLIGGTNASNESPEVTGKSAGCIYEFSSGQDTYFFYQILIPR